MMHESLIHGDNNNNNKHGTSGNGNVNNGHSSSSSDMMMTVGGGGNHNNNNNIIDVTSTLHHQSQSVSSSSAKRRLEAMATSVDHKLAAAFSIILVLYSIITFGTWAILESQPYRSEVIEITSSHALGLPDPPEVERVLPDKTVIGGSGSGGSVDISHHHDAIAAAVQAANAAAASAGGAKGGVRGADSSSASHPSSRDAKQALEKKVKQTPLPPPPAAAHTEQQQEEQPAQDHSNEDQPKQQEQQQQQQPETIPRIVIDKSKKQPEELQPVQQQQEKVESGAVELSKHTIIKADDITDIDTLQHTFPIHASKDLEIINHPGIFFANREQMKKVMDQHPGLPKDGKMAVPRWWKPTAYGPGGIREYLGQYGQRLITPDEAAHVGSYTKDGNETIFISIASYRDWECQPTVSDIYERADFPERIRVAVVDQRVAGDDDVAVPPCGKPKVPCDQDPEQATCKYAHLIDVYEVPAILSVGPVFARHLAYRMYRGEYYAMQVDSHVRFIEHWDTDLISQWKSAKNEMAVITTYLSDITDSIDPVTHANNHPNRPIMCKTDYEGHGKLKHLRHGQQPEGKPGIHGEPTLHPFWAAGFSFARGHFVVQVPYDQYQPMVFQGEEIFMGLRGFTYGYDYYTAETSVAFHMYAVKGNKEIREKINKFWENSNLYPGSAVEGMKRLNGIIGTGDPGDEFYHGEEKEYGLGHCRDKDQFYRLYGIHTESKTVEDHLCSFVGRPMQEKFKPFLRENRMGIDFSQIDFEYKDPNPPTESPRKGPVKLASKYTGKK